MCEECWTRLSSRHALQLSALCRQHHSAPYKGWPRSAQDLIQRLSHQATNLSKILTPCFVVLSPAEVPYLIPAVPAKGFDDGRAMCLTRQAFLITLTNHLHLPSCACHLQSGMLALDGMAACRMYDDEQERKACSYGTDVLPKAYLE